MILSLFLVNADNTTARHVAVAYLVSIQIVYWFGVNNQ